MVVMTHKATVVATNITARINISPSFAAQHHFALQYSDCPNTFNKLESLFCGAKDVVEGVDRPKKVRRASRPPSRTEAGAAPDG
jgi:hypothetical protein